MRPIRATDARTLFLIVRMKLIGILAQKEPILLNWNINPANVKEGKSAIYVPSDKTRLEYKELADKAVLVPTKNILQPNNLKEGIWVK